MRTIVTVRKSTMIDVNGEGPHDVPCRRRSACFRWIGLAVCPVIQQVILFKFPVDGIIILANNSYTGK